MALSSTFRRSVTLMVDRRLSGAELGQHVAAAARGGLAELVTSGAASPVYTRFVDGRLGAPEETVKLDGGTISYLFSNLAQACIFALAVAIERSPVRSGRSRQGWFIAVDGRPWTQALATIPAGAQVTLTNREPYHRMIDAGGQRVSVPPGIVEDTRQAVQRRYPLLQVDRSFVTIPGGYVLKGRGVESGLTYSKKTGFDRKHAPRPARAKDRRAGQALTYPAVVMSERTR